MDNNILDKLIQQEQDFYKQDFVAPILAPLVNVQIAGVIQTMLVSPHSYRGFAVLRPNQSRKARVVRPTNLIETQKYLSILPRVICIVTSIERQTGLLFINDGRFKIEGEIPIHFMENVQLFDIINVRFDGINFLFDSINRGHFVVSQQVRDLFQNKQSANKVPLNWVKAYQVAVKDRLQLESLSTEGKLQTYATRAKADFKGYKERSDGYSVEFEVDGQTYISTIDKNFRVISAGICLSGGDKTFDFQSLITVIREGQHRHLIHRTR